VLSWSVHFGMVLKLLSTSLEVADKKCA